MTSDQTPSGESSTRRGVGAVETGMRVLMTACYDASQMFIATALGAAFIAPYFGRMLEKGLPAYEALAQMRAIGQSMERAPRILVASLRDTDQMARLAGTGQDCFTIAPKIARALLNDANTKDAAAEFEVAARS